MEIRIDLWFICSKFYFCCFYCSLPPQNFQNAYVTSNKMVHKKRHHFLAQFSIPFHMVWSVLLRVLAQKTTFWLVEILWQPIRSFYSMVFEANTRNKTEHTMWKGMENCARKWCLFLCTILFEVTWPFWKMWSKIGHSHMNETLTIE